MKNLLIHIPGTTITKGFQHKYSYNFIKYLEKILENLLSVNIN